MTGSRVARNTVLILLGASVLVWAIGSTLKSRKTIADLREKLTQSESNRQNLLEDKLAKPRTGAIRVPGKIEAAEAVAVTPRVEAPIARVAIHEGQIVDAGALLIELETTELEAQVAQSQKRLHEMTRALHDIERLYPDRESLYKQAVERVALAYHNEEAAFQAELEQSDRAVERSAVELKAKTLELERARLLAEESLASQADYDNAKLAQRKAEIEAKQREAEFRDLRRKADGAAGDAKYARIREAELKRDNELKRVEEERITDEDLAKARAALEECGQRVELAKGNLAAAQIRASIRGVVTAAANSPRLSKLSGVSQMTNGRALNFEELREVGKRVGPQDVLLVVEGLDDVTVKVAVDEMDINRLRIGQEARIEGVGFPGAPLRGTLVDISPKATYVGKGITTFEATVKILEPLGAARLGMSAEVDILSKETP
ncbi:MAG: HlyD family efflux transporter periplasmic adaptor subunit [Candidatus Hydrogenedentes bacterium]|nr:HlyD family efflux transporter periplasmic adaptor subunit [Candidatus Hydrogenedentota bacterium]